MRSYSALGRGDVATFEFEAELERSIELPARADRGRALTFGPSIIDDSSRQEFG